MKSMKQIFPLFVLLMSMASSKVFAYDIAVKNADGVIIYYNIINSNKELMVTYDDTDYYYDEGILYNYNSYSGNVVIPKEVTYGNVTRKVTKIGENAFCYCSGLTSITIPNSVKAIGNDAFCGCSSLTSMSVPNSVTSIGLYAFENCSSLTSIIIPNSVTIIGGNLFSGCSSLTSITIEEGNAFYDSRDNCNAIIETKTNKLISACQKTVIPNTVVEIAGTAFWGCERLSKLVIPFSVTSIDDRLQSSSLFSGCNNLQVIVVDEKNPVYDSRDNCNAIIETETNRLIAGCAITVIPNSVSTIGRGSFAGIDNLETVYLPNGITGIERYAFCDCINLKSITLPNSLKSIGEDVIANSAITEIFSYITTPFTTGYWGEGYNYKEISLYVPIGTKSIYERTKGWTDFHIVEWDTGASIEQCIKPNIYYNNGELIFKSNTEGATCQYQITDEDVKSGIGNTVQLTVTYHISVYATKSGYQNSEVAEATLCWIEVDPQKEGITEETTTDAKQMKAIPVLIQEEDGKFRVTGSDEGTRISIFDANGVEVGSAISRDGQAMINTPLPQGSIAIVKIGEKAVKVVMK